MIQLQRSFSDRNVKLPKDIPICPKRERNEVDTKSALETRVYKRDALSKRWKPDP